MGGREGGEGRRSDRAGEADKACAVGDTMPFLFRPRELGRDTAHPGLVQLPLHEARRCVAVVLDFNELQSLFHNKRNDYTADSVYSGTLVPGDAVIRYKHRYAVKLRGGVYM